MKKKLRLILLAVFLVSTALLARQLMDNAGGGSSYDSALALATAGGSKKAAPVQTEAAQIAEETILQWVPEEITGDAHMEALADLDLDALRQVNPDVIGWIRIPDSKVDYPLLQGTDNEYYLKHTWDGKENSVGSIFLEHRSSPELMDFNTIVYGHNMNDGSMFANIRRYSTEWYWERHPYVYVRTDAGVYRYEVFSGYEASVDSITYCLSFNQETTKVEFLRNAIERSSADMGIRPELTDRILTLSTCSGMGYSNRWVVHGRLKMVPGE